MAETTSSDGMAMGICRSELIKRVIYRIENEPESVELTGWLRTYYDNGDVCSFDTVGDAQSALRRGELCNTTACVAGWLVVEAIDMGAALDDPYENIDYAAARLLDIRPLNLRSGDEPHLFLQDNTTAEAISILESLLER